MKPTLLSLLFIIFLFAANAQAPAIEWQNTIGGSGYDELRSIQQTVDGGFILGGFSNSPISGDKTENTSGLGNHDYDYWVVKLDIYGNIEWQNTIGGSMGDILHSIQQTADGGYILGGHSYSGITRDKTEYSRGGYDYWVVKLDISGNIQWQNTIGGSSEEYIPIIRQTDDGGYILGGTSLSDISGDKTENNWNLSIFRKDFWIVKLDSSGNIQWQNTIGGDQSDEVSSIEQTKDGSYIIGGTSDSHLSGDKTENSMGTHDYWVIELDASGNIQWQNTIGGSLGDGLGSIQPTSDGGYILGGSSLSGISGDKTEASQGENDYWVVKLDATGNILWQNTIGGNRDDILISIQQTIDGGYILGGWSDSGTSGDKTETSLGDTTHWFGGSDYWIVKLDASGNIQWQNTIGGNNGEELNSIQQTTDGGYILGGKSISNISGDKIENSLVDFDYWVIKFSDLQTISGQLLTGTGLHIPGVSVTLSGDDSLTDVTDTSGRYSFTISQGGTYTITPSKNNDSIANNGVSSVDLLLMRAHILATVPFSSPYKIIAAAEVNATGDAAVSTQDILFTRSLILGNITSFPTNRLWQFVSSDYVFPDTQHPFPFPSTRTYNNITTNQTNQNFIGIKLGDVNRSWDGNIP